MSFIRCLVEEVLTRTPLDSSRQHFIKLLRDLEPSYGVDEITAMCQDILDRHYESWLRADEYTPKRYYVAQLLETDPDELHRSAYNSYFVDLFDEDMTGVDGEYLRYECDECGSDFRKGDGIIDGVDGEYVCDDCLDHRMYVCERCGEEFQHDDGIRDSSQCTCNRCLTEKDN